MNPPEELLKSTAEKIGVGKHTRHVFLCLGPSCCTPEVGEAAWNALKKAIKDENLTTCARTKVGCLRICCEGPTMVVYPEGTYYRNMTAERIAVFGKKHLVEGEPIRDWIFAENPLGKPQE
jgi:(2Fe-2S) ferredoxin